MAIVSLELAHEISLKWTIGLVVMGMRQRVARVRLRQLLSISVRFHALTVLIVGSYSKH